MLWLVFWCFPPICGRYRTANIYLCSAFTAIEQWEFFNVPNPLGPRTFVFKDHLREPVTLIQMYLLPSVWQWSCNYRFKRLRSIAVRYKSFSSQCKTILRGVVIFSYNTCEFETHSEYKFKMISHISVIIIVENMLLINIHVNGRNSETPNFYASLMNMKVDCLNTQ